jgi:hypothetical protein
LMVEAGVVQLRFVFSVVKAAVFYGVAGAVGEDEGVFSGFRGDRWVRVRLR